MAKTKAELCRLGLDFLRMAIRLKLTFSVPLIFLFPPQAKDWDFPSGMARLPVLSDQR